MTRTAKRGPERWRDEFEGRGQTPIFWQIQARSLLCAANVLRERADAMPATAPRSRPTSRNRPTCD